MRKTLAATLVACAATALVPAGAGAAAKEKSARFWIEVNGTQYTTWEEKRHNTYFDCQGQRWERGGGSEEINFRTKKIKALVTLRGGSVQVKYGTWDRFKQGDYYMRGKGSVDRIGESVFGIDPDERCWDGDKPTETSGPYDCRPYQGLTYDVDLNWRGKTLETDASPLITTHPKYDKCPIVTPDGVQGASFTTIPSQDFDYRDLFAKRFKYHEILGSKDFTYDDKRHTTAYTKVRWTARFRRVK